MSTLGAINSDLKLTVQSLLRDNEWPTNPDNQKILKTWRNSVNFEKQVGHPSIPEGSEGLLAYFE